MTLSDSNFKAEDVHLVGRLLTLCFFGSYLPASIDDLRGIFMGDIPSFRRLRSLWYRSYLRRRTSRRQMDKFFSDTSKPSSRDFQSKPPAFAEKYSALDGFSRSSDPPKEVSRSIAIIIMVMKLLLVEFE